MAFACKTATFGPELQVSMGPRLHLSFCKCKTAWLASEILVSMSPSPHRCFVHANRDFWSRITSLYWSQPSSLVLCIQNSDFMTWNKCLYWSQPSSVVFACKTASFAQELKVSMCPTPHLFFFVHAQLRNKHQNYYSIWVPALFCGFCMQTATLGPESQVPMGPRLHLSFCACTTAW